MTLPAISRQDQDSMERWQAKSFTDWDFDGLPAAITLKNHGQNTIGYLYPALVVAQENSVRLVFARDLEKARQHNVAGMLALVPPAVCRSGQVVEKLLHHFFIRAIRHSGCSTDLGPRNRRRMRLFTFILRSIFSPLTGEIEYTGALSRDGGKGDKRKACTAEGRRYVTGSWPYSAEERKLLTSYSVWWPSTASDVFSRGSDRPSSQSLIAAIVPADFLENGRNDRLDDCDRYLRSLAVRIERLHANPAKDATKEAQIRPHLENLARICSRDSTFTGVAEARSKNTGS